MNQILISNLERTEVYPRILSLLSQRQNWDISDSLENLLLICSEYGHSRLVKYILSLVSDSEIKSDSLTLAAQNGHLETLKILRDIDPERALRVACHCGQTEIVQFLLEQGIRDDHCLARATSSDSLGIVELLLKYGYSPDHLSLNYSIRNQNRDIFKILLGRSSQIEKDLEYSISYSLTTNSIGIFEYLLKIIPPNFQIGPLTISHPDFLDVVSEYQQ